MDVNRHRAVKAAVRGLAERAYARHIQRAAQERKIPRKSSSPGALPVQILSTSVDGILVGAVLRRPPWCPGPGSRIQGAL